EGDDADVEVLDLNRQRGQRVEVRAGEADAGDSGDPGDDARDEGRCPVDEERAYDQGEERDDGKPADEHAQSPAHPSPIGKTSLAQEVSCMGPNKGLSS